MPVCWAGWLAWLAGWLPGWLPAWLAAWLAAACLPGWLPAWQSGCLAAWLAAGGRLAGSQALRERGAAGVSKLEILLS